MKEIDDMDLLIGKILSGNASAADEEMHQKLLSESEEYATAFSKSQKVWARSAWLAEKDVRADKVKTQSRLNASILKELQSNKRTIAIYKLVAILAFPVAIALSILFYPQIQSRKTVATLAEISAPLGNVASCKLPDGTTVWINSGSTIKYNDADFNSKEREISLDGEAYFQVAKNKKVPFIVRTALADVRVTGTSFNVKAIAEDSVFETALSEGSVLLFAKNEGKEAVKLSPGELATFASNTRSFEIQKVDVDRYSSWRDGEIIFKDATLLDLMQELERVYGIEFQIENQDLADFRFRGRFSYNNNLIDVLERIKSTSHIDYRIENKKVWLSKMN